MSPGPGQVGGNRQRTGNSGSLGKSHKNVFTLNNNSLGIYQPGPLDIIFMHKPCLLLTYQNKSTAIRIDRSKDYKFSKQILGPLEKQIDIFDILPPKQEDIFDF